MNRGSSPSRPSRNHPRRPLFFRHGGGGTKADSNRRRSSSNLLIGIDTGGTFTDFIGIAGRRLYTHKRLSTPAEPARAVLDGLHELLSTMLASSARAGEVLADFMRGHGQVDIIYGSTVATNAVLERKGARVVLLTTTGFEDLLEIGRQARPVLYTLEPRKPEPLVPRARRVGVAERLAFDGSALRPLTKAGVRAAVGAVRQLRAESVAVCLLHAYADPVHERRLARALARLDVPYSISHELVAEYREYERLSTTVLNAYVAPVVSRHLRELEDHIGQGVVRVTQSNGGVISLATASREPVRTLLSGPAGGVVGALAVARRLGIERIITFDMGGTSTDVSLVDGAAVQQTEWHIADLPVKVPAIDIHTVGAGGGSLATCDAGGVLKVGPESAGADPGPACYGSGDTATVTDADLVIGRLVPEAFLAGQMTLDVDRARRAVARVGRQLGLNAEDTADGIVRVVNAGMERALRRISVERGHDPRTHALVSFGGAGGMHACELAMAVGIARVIVPHHPGLLSAWGALSAPAQRDYVQTVRLVNPDTALLKRTLASMETRALSDLRREAGPGARIAVATGVDARYRGQSYEIRIPMQRDYRARFHVEHERRYGYRDEGRAIEVVNVRVSATVAAPPVPRVAVERTPQPWAAHSVYWRGRWLRTRRIARTALAVGRRIPGPLVITELSATTFVPPGWAARALPSGDLLLESRPINARMK